MLLLLALFFVCALGNTLLEDQHVLVMVRGGKACAIDKDLLDQVFSISHVTNMNESWNTYEWVMAHI